MESSDADDPARPYSYASHVGTDFGLCDIVEVLEVQVRFARLAICLKVDVQRSASYYDRHLGSFAVENFLLNTLSSRVSCASGAKLRFTPQSRYDTEEG